MGANEWRDECEWPLARTQWTPFYLHSGGSANSRFGDGTLSTRKPEAEPTDNYHYDPAHPVPFITDPTSSQIGGPDDYSAIDRRDDVLVYVTEPLAEDIEVTGPIRVDLYASSSAPDTDFMAKLVDIWPTGFTQRLCDGMVRARFREGMDRPSLIEPGRIYHYSINCWNTSQVRSEPLAEDIEVTGPIRVDLYASSSAPDTDFMAKLVDIWPTGFTQRLCDGMVRARFREGMDRPSLIEPGRIYHYSINCWNTSQV